MRLVAFRLPREVADLRRRRIKLNAKRRGRTLSRELLDLQDWQIYLTSCAPETLSFEDVMSLYRQRWTIEILFKGFKSHMRIDQVPPSCSEVMLRSLILSALLRIVLTHVIILPILEKLPDECLISSLKLLSLVEAIETLGENASSTKAWQYENALKHCCYEQRNRKSLPQRLNALG